MGKVIGIDLGTTNSCMSVYERGKSRVIPNKEGKNTTPSIVSYTDKGEVLVGDPAKRQAVANPKKTIYSIKRIMGLMYNEEKAKEAAKRLPYKIVDKNGACAIEINGKIYTPQEISSKVLIKLKDDAGEFLGEEVTDAVITVPAYFNDAQRKATKEAGTIAGLNVLRIINEPTSAALAYGLDKKNAEKIAVYDLGGGTFDVTLLETGDNVVEVIATGGDAFLGGDDFDNRLIDWACSEFKSQSGIDLKGDLIALQRLKDSVENAKKELSTLSETDINLPFITADASGPKHFVQKLTRSKFESLIEDLVDQTIVKIDEVMKDAKLQKSDIKEIVLVGGSTRVPMVQQKVKDYFGKDLDKSVNPDEVVAIGAAIQAAIIRGDVKDVLLLDVTPLSLGIETLGGVMTKVIEKGTTIPAQKKQVFSTAENNQTVVTIHVLQGEREFAKDNKSLGQFNLEGIPPAQRGIPQIEVTFDIDANGILTVSAKDKATNKEQQIKITGSSGLDESEIERMIKDAEVNKQEDQKRKSIVEAKNRADSLIHQTEKSLKDIGENIDIADKDNINKAIEDLKTALKDENVTKEILDQKIQNLSESSHKLAENLYKKKESQSSQNQQNANTSSSDKDPNKSDDVIDAEIEDSK